MPLSKIDIPFSLATLSDPSFQAAVLGHDIPPFQKQAVKISEIHLLRRTTTADTAFSMLRGAEEGGVCVGGGCQAAMHRDCRTSHSPETGRQSVIHTLRSTTAADTASKQHTAYSTTRGCQEVGVAKVLCTWGCRTSRVSRGSPSRSEKCTLAPPAWCAAVSSRSSSLPANPSSHVTTLASLEARGTQCSPDKVVRACVGGGGSNILLSEAGTQT